MKTFLIGIKEYADLYGEITYSNLENGEKIQKIPFEVQEF